MMHKFVLTADCKVGKSTDDKHMCNFSPTVTGRPNSTPENCSPRRMPAKQVNGTNVFGWCMQKL